jgi:Secretion system C-terminal sorting domain/Beta-propeller repeat
MKKVYFFFLTVLSVFYFSFISAQTVSQAWSTSYGSPGTDLFTAVSTDGSGNVYLTGSENVTNSAGRATIVKYNAAGTMQWLVRYNGPLTYTETNASVTDAGGNTYIAAKPRNTSHSSLAVVKYNTNAQQQWVSLFDSSATLSIDPRAISIDGSGNVYVAGTINSDLTDYDIIVLKFNSTGARQWTKTFNGTANSNDFTGGLTVDGSGNVYVIGQTYSTNAKGGKSFDYVTIKYSSTGTVLWTAKYNYSATSFESPKGIRVDGSGNVYVTGFSGTTSGADYATLKYNSTGQLQWATRFAGPWGLDDYASGLVVDGPGNVYVTGSSRYSSSYDQIATVKYSPDGVQQWVTYYYGNPSAQPGAGGIGMDNTGNIYVTGRALDPGVTNPDAVTIKYNTSGTQIWAKRYNNVWNGSDEGAGLRLYKSNVLTIDPPVLYIGGTTNTGSGQDLLLIKYTQQTGSGTISSRSETGQVPDLPARFGAAASPNPSHGRVNITYSIPREARVTLKIYDVSGTEVTTLFSGSREAGQYMTVFDASNLKSQVYYYSLTARSAKENYKETKPVVVGR